MKTQNIRVPLIDIKEACCSNDKTVTDCRMMVISAARLEMVMTSIFNELNCTCKPSWVSRVLASAVTRSQSLSNWSGHTNDVAVEARIADIPEATWSIPAQFALFVSSCASAASTNSSSVKSPEIGVTMRPREDMREPAAAAATPPDVTVSLDNTPTICTKISILDSCQGGNICSTCNKSHSSIKVSIKYVNSDLDDYCHQGSNRIRDTGFCS